MIHEHEQEHEQMELDKHIEDICAELRRKELESFRISIEVSLMGFF